MNCTNDRHITKKYSEQHQNFTKHSRTRTGLTSTCSMPSRLSIGHIIIMLGFPELASSLLHTIASDVQPSLRQNKAGGYFSDRPVQPKLQPSVSPRCTTEYWVETTTDELSKQQPCGWKNLLQFLAATKFKTTYTNTHTHRYIHSLTYFRCTFCPGRQRTTKLHCRTTTTL